MKYVSKPQEVIAFQFPCSAQVTFEKEDPLMLAKGDWLVFLPTEEKLVVGNKEFAKRFSEMEVNMIGEPFGDTGHKPLRKPRKPKGGLKGPVLQADGAVGASTT